MLKFIQNDKFLVLGRLHEIARKLARTIYFYKSESAFSADFGMLDTTDLSNADLDDILLDVHYWHGIKEVKYLGFGTTSKNFIFSWYGGECRVDALSILDDDHLDDTIERIKQIMIKQFEPVYDDSCYIVLQLDKDKSLREDEDCSPKDIKNVSYGVNIGTKHSDGIVQYERYLTFYNKKDAQKVFDILLLGNEKCLWSSVELEEIHELENGDFNYYTLQKSDIKNDKEVI